MPEPSFQRNKQGSCDGSLPREDTALLALDSDCGGTAGRWALSCRASLPQDPVPALLRLSENSLSRGLAPSSQVEAEGRGCVSPIKTRSS